MSYAVCKLNDVFSFSGFPVRTELIRIYRTIVSDPDLDPGISTKTDPDSECEICTYLLFQIQHTFYRFRCYSPSWAIKKQNSFSIAVFPPFHSFSSNFMSKTVTEVWRSHYQFLCRIKKPSKFNHELQVSNLHSITIL